MVYGAGAKGNMPKMLQAVSRHRFPPVPEVGNRRSMVHVSDVIRAAVLCSASFASPRETVDRSVRELQETQHWIGRAVDQSRS